MITVDVDDSGLQVMLNGIRSAMNDLTPIWPQVRDVYMTFMRQQFTTEGGYAGVDWAPLSGNYARWKSQQAPGKTILRFRDRMYNSLTQQNHADQVYRTEPQKMEWGTRVPYARFHQLGTHKMPKRVVMPPPTREQGEAMVDILQAFIFRRARGERR